VTAVNSNGTVNLVDGDFLGPSNISVQYNTDVPGPSWYSSGEEWAFVSPQLPSAVTAFVFWRGTNGDLYQAQGPADGKLGGASLIGMGPIPGPGPISASQVLSTLTVWLVSGVARPLRPLPWQRTLGRRPSARPSEQGRRVPIPALRSGRQAGDLILARERER
jgi:hypothetical protein